MLIADRMTRHPVLVPPTMSATEAQRILAENHIRHLPVVDSGKRLSGLVTRQQFMLKSDAVGSLNVCDISRYLADLKVNQVMIKRRDVVTVRKGRTVERASQIMADQKIGCLPVLEEDNIVVGIVTETDLLRAFQEMLGLRTEGVRITVRMRNIPGEFTKLMAMLVERIIGCCSQGTDLLGAGCRLAVAGLPVKGRGVWLAWRFFALDMAVAFTKVSNQELKRLRRARRGVPPGRYAVCLRPPGSQSPASLRSAQSAGGLRDPEIPA